MHVADAMLLRCVWYFFHVTVDDVEINYNLSRAMEPILMGSHSQCKKHIKIKYDPESAFPKTWTIMTCQTSSLMTMPRVT